MPTLTFDTREFPRLDALVRSYDDAPPRRKRAALDEIGRRMVRALTRRGSGVPVDTGRYKARFGWVKRADRVVIYNRVPYSVYVEAGYPAPRTRHTARRAIRRQEAAIVRAVRKRFPA